MSADKEYRPPDSTAVIERVLCRCRTCQRQWSVGPEGPKRCPCSAASEIGGELLPMNMTKHVQSLPYAPMLPLKPVKAT